LLQKLPKKVNLLSISCNFDHLSEQELASVDCLLFGAGPMGARSIHLKEVFGKLRNVKWIHNLMAGLDPFMFGELLEAKGVTITNSKGVYSQALAEYVMFAAKYFALKTPKLLEYKANKVWEQFPVQKLSGKTMGLLGVGDIGRSVASLAKAYGMTVLGCRRTPTPSNANADPLLDETFPTSDLAAMARESDFLVVSTPLTEATKHIVDAKLMSVMKPDAVVINVGRGPCIDEKALVEALKKGTIKGAALDVFEVEPLPQDSELWTMKDEKVLISYHNANKVENWLQDSFELFFENMRRFLDQKDLRNVVDLNRGY
jgi:phosphoglycerate dehydrogenase-like enzyme